MVSTAVTTRACLDCPGPRRSTCVHALAQAPACRARTRGTRGTWSAYHVGREGAVLATGLLNQFMGEKEARRERKSWRLQGWHLALPAFVVLLISALSFPPDTAASESADSICIALRVDSSTPGEPPAPDALILGSLPQNFVFFQNVWHSHRTSSVGHRGERRTNTAGARG